MSRSRLDQFTKKERREIMRAATRAVKSGVEPSSPIETPESIPRYQQRQMARALGNRGSKSAKKNPERMARQTEERREQLRQVLVVDDALQAAQERVEHPIRSRLKR